MTHFRSIVEEIQNWCFSALRGHKKKFKTANIWRTTAIFFCKNIVFPAEAEYSYFPVDF